MTTACGLDQLTLALGFARWRKPLREKWLRHGGLCSQLLCNLRGGPNAFGSALAIFGTTVVRFDALKQGLGLCRAAMHCLEASE